MGLVDLLQSIIPPALFFSAPLIFTALGGVFSERSGVVNIGLEGLMIMGAFVGIVFNLAFADVLGAWTPWISILVAMVVSAIFAMIHAVASVSFRADQVVSGVAINFLALGLGVFLTKQWYGKGQTDMVSEPFYTTNILGLSDIPFIGPIFFQGIYVTSYVAIILAFIAWYVLYKTPFGLQLRAVGEHPMAADTNGINVYKMRYIAVILSGAFGGLGGSVFALTIALNFSHATIVGQGFMSLAAVIFGKWHPLGAMGAALFFGFAQSLSVISSGVPFLEDVPQVLLLIAPYVLTILALAGFIGRAEAPKANGVPYIKGGR
ncbi:nucleoside ABC transporter membrane protein [Virgibacillus subterraneus]|uniref:Nucleoside ABC transporter membrane protein n=2 Tax=Virgibacillus TaxID=84406 RepID=A0A1H1C561_9BACI|nr:MULTISPECIES: ABC transporter permease [Virgibacillus]SDQ59190.1 nucleoside ABC transporter membrane protein [Virgibacillus salinus]SEQ56394.1 nucleoside ABC transporter membrane protein [Virgibacillus subterraneus]